MTKKLKLIVFVFSSKNQFLENENPSYQKKTLKLKNIPTLIFSNKPSLVLVVTLVPDTRLANHGCTHSIFSGCTKSKLQDLVTSIKTLSDSNSPQNNQKKFSPVSFIGYSVLECHGWSAGPIYAWLRRGPGGCFRGECWWRVNVRVNRFLSPIHQRRARGRTGHKYPFSRLRCVPTGNGKFTSIGGTWSTKCIACPVTKRMFWTYLKLFVRNIFNRFALQWPRTRNVFSARFDMKKVSLLLKPRFSLSRLHGGPVDAIKISRKKQDEVLLTA